MASRLSFGLGPAGSREERPGTLRQVPTPGLAPGWDPSSAVPGDVTFPSSHFGKLYGLAMSLSASFSLLQYPCFALVNGALGGDPLYVNIGLTLLSLLAFIHPLYVYFHCRKVASQRDKSKTITFSS
ncbi:hypothetical protein AMECASPLE_037038 [Ameca splendens]|uniref:Uncharacterized protein n=1 Tax=Ameca splendens TaxID=208324 RepID=A0ABV0ZSK8_9TELE